MTALESLDVHEHRLAPADLEALRRLVGVEVRQIAAATLDVTIPNGPMGSHSLAVPLSGQQRDFVNITSDWLQLPHNDIHLLRAAVTDRPVDIPVGEASAGGSRPVGPCSWIKCPGFGPVAAVEIVSYEIDGKLLDARGAVVGRQSLRYDRALRLRFAAGEALTLSTAHDSILGEIEIRRGDEIGSVEPDACVQIHRRLN